MSRVVLLLILSISVPVWASDAATSGPRFNISFSASAHAQPVTGRLFLMVSRTDEPEVRLQSTWFNSPEIVAVDVRGLNADHAVVVDGTAAGTPLRSLREIPPGDYYVQAVLNVYTEFHRADGHVLWLHMDQGEGQQFNRSPGNLYSKMQRLHLAGAGEFNLALSEVIPPLPVPQDTQWVKYLRIQSKLLTQFWGRPMYVGAIVLLPRGYAEQADRRYPVIYYQPEHFRGFPPFEFRSDEPHETPGQRQEREAAGFENGYEFQRAWRAEHFPRMIAVSVLTPTPFADWSSGIDSANNGPYGEAITKEVIPYIEAHFRTISETYARVLTGKHSGGRAALALQVLHSDVFGGVWAFHPWAFNFEHYFTVNIYTSENAFEMQPAELPDWGRNIVSWLPIERPVTRGTDGVPFASFRQLSQHDAVMADMAGGDPLTADDAIVGPIGANGYPQPLWDRQTGKIDHKVALYWRDHGDLAYYTRENWPRIGPNLVGKVHLYVGDADQFFRNNGVHQFEEILKATRDPHYAGEFVYGGLSGGRQPMTNAQLVRIMAEQVAQHAPKDGQAWLHE
jgi:hypothetical protein